MDLVEVDVVELQAAQALLQRRDDVAARRAAHVRAGAGLAEDLGRDDDALARDLEVLQRLPGDLFRAAGRVHVGGVDEIDARVERAADDPLGLVLLQAADLAPHAFFAAAEGHGAEAELGDEEAGAAEGIELHAMTSKGMRRANVSAHRTMRCRTGPCTRAAASASTGAAR